MKFAKSMCFITPAARLFLSFSAVKSSIDADICVVLFCVSLIPNKCFSLIACQNVLHFSLQRSFYIHEIAPFCREGDIPAWQSVLTPTFSSSSFFEFYFPVSTPLLIPAFITYSVSILVFYYPLGLPMHSLSCVWWGVGFSGRFSILQET